MTIGTFQVMWMALGICLGLVFLIITLVFAFDTGSKAEGDWERYKKRFIALWSIWGVLFVPHIAKFWLELALM